MQLVKVGNPIAMVPLSSGLLLLAQAAAQGIANGILYLTVVNSAGIWEMIPQSEWSANGITPAMVNGQPLYLSVTFGAPPTSEAWGNYMTVGELAFYLQNPGITGGLTLRQLVGLAG